MALNIPMPESPGSSLLKGLDTGSTLMNRIMQSKLDQARLNQQQNQFEQSLALQKESEGRQQTLLPFLIQQYKDAHNTAAREAEMKAIYQNIIRDALAGNGAGVGGGGIPSSQPGVVAQPVGVDPNVSPVGTVATLGNMPNSPPAAAGQVPGSPVPPQPQTVAPTTQMGGEQELRAGNPRLASLDKIAGLVPGIPKPVTHFANGMLYTTYPSGRMTAQAVNLPGAKTPGERNVSAKEASRLREQATALINSAHLVQQGYDLLDNNTDLTGPGSGLATMFNMSNNPELGKFITATGKLQAELGKYASQRGGIQAVKWAESVKPSQWKPEDYNYGMFEGIQRNIQDDFNTLNQQYRAATGEDLPVSLPQITSKRAVKGKEGSSPKVTKWKMTGGQLVKE